MKLSSLLCAAVVSLAALAPVTASAGHEYGERTRVTYDRCGNPVFWTYTCVGHDRCGRPIFRWVQQSRGYGGGHGGGYDRGDRGGYGGGYDRGGYRGDRGDRGDRCDSGGYSGSGVSFYWSR